MTREDVSDAIRNAGLDVYGVREINTRKNPRFEVVSPETPERIKGAFPSGRYWQNPARGPSGSSIHGNKIFVDMD